MNTRRRKLPKELQDEMQIIVSILTKCDDEGKIDVDENRHIKYDKDSLVLRKETLDLLYNDPAIDKVWGTIEKERNNEFRKSSNNLIRKAYPYVHLFNFLESLLGDEPNHEQLNETDRARELRRIIGLGKELSRSIEKYDLENSTGRIYEHFDDAQLTGLRMVVLGYNDLSKNQMELLSSYRESEKVTHEIYDGEILEESHFETIETLRYSLQGRIITSPTFSQLLVRFTQQIEVNGFPERSNKRRNENASRNRFVKRLVNYYLENYGEPFYADVAKIANCLLDLSLSGDEVRFIHN